MATQKVDRFSHLCGELDDENDWFCVKCCDKRRSALDSESNNGLKESKRPKSSDEYVKEKEKEGGGFLKPKFLQNSNKSSKSNRKAPNSRAEVVINVGLIKAENSIVSIKRQSCLNIKNSKKFSFIVRKRVPPTPLFMAPTSRPKLPHFLKSLFPLPSFLFHPFVRNFRQFPPPSRKFLLP